MRRIWPLALLLAPLGAWLLRPEPGPVGPPLPARIEVDEPPSDPSTTAPPPRPPVDPAPEEEAATADLSEVPDRDAWRRSPFLRSFVWLARHQNEDGSWGDGDAELEGHAIGKPGITSLALQSLFCAGYSHLSRDVHGGQDFGLMIRKALTWLKADQEVNGTLRSTADGGFDQVLSALTLNEAYGMTGSQALKDVARSSFETLARLQNPDGTWGGPAPTAWAITAVRAADWNDFPMPDGLKERALGSLGKSWHALDLRNWNYLTRTKLPQDPRALSLAAALPELGDLARWYHAANSLMSSEGPKGALWRAFAEPMKHVVLAQQDADGRWPGGTTSQSVVRSSLAVLTLETFYVHHNCTGSCDH